VAKRGLSESGKGEVNDNPCNNSSIVGPYQFIRRLEFVLFIITDEFLIECGLQVTKAQSNSKSSILLK